MSNYTKSTNFATKDNLSPGDPLKIVRGTEIDTEFNNISTAISTKTDNSAAAITGGSITGITDLAVADGGTGASTAAGALNNLLPSQTGNSSKYLQTDGTNATWDAISINTGDITGTLGVTNGGTGVTTSTGTGNVVLSNSPTLVTPALGTPSALVGTNITGTASGLTAGNVTTNANLTGAVTSVGNATSLGSFSSANLLAALTDETGTGSAVFATSPTLVTPALGTPSALVGTNITGTASGLTAGNVTTNANLTGAVTSVGNATSLGSFSSANLLGALTDETGTGSAVFATSPTLVTPILGTPTSATLTNATGLPIGTGVSGLGTGVATFLATPSSANLRSALTDETGTGSAVFATSPTLVTPLLGTPTSGVATNLTGLPLTTGVTGTLPTANGGTNLTSFTSGGVVYASSSSALATGSVLVFDGTTLSNLGSGDRAKFGNGTRNIFIAGDTNGVSLLDGAAQSGNGWYMNSASNFVAGYVSSSEVLRLTSSSLYTASGINVGFGTSSPAQKLDVNGNARIGNATAGTNRYLYINGVASKAGAIIFQESGADKWYMGNGAASENGNFEIYNALGNNTVITPAGNLGLGVTPSAWNTGYKAFVAGGTNGNNQVGGIASGSGITIVSTNYYRSSTPDEIYAGTGYAMKYLQSSGQHQWYTATSGTAGNAISFTQAMTLTASSQLLVGTTTSPSGSAPALVVQTSVGGGVQYAHGSGGGGLIYALSAGGLTFNTYTGAVGSESYLERARITSGGYFKASSTGAYLGSTGGFHELRSNTDNNNAAIISHAGTSGTQYGLSIRTTNDQNDSTRDFLDCQGGGTLRAQIRTNGGIANYSANDVNLSDRREKTNFAPATSYLDKICAIPVQTFNYIDQNLEEDGGLTLGVVAQDVQAVAPELVMESNWAKQGDEPKMRLSIYQTDLQYALMKCIQEQQAIIESLKARLDAANL